MEKIKIITDSTSYITKEYARENNIPIVPLSYYFSEEMEKEGFPGEFENFFYKLENSDLFPNTSQPSTGDFLEEYERAFKEGYEEIIVILLSSKLSGTYNSANLAKDILGDERISIVDSEQAASNLRFLVEDATNMSKDGKTMEDIVEHLENKKKQMYVYLTVDTLEYLKRGGRLSSFQSAIGSVLKIKPIIQLKDGVLDSLEKTRGKNKALNSMGEKIFKDVEKISICHVLDIKEAEKFKSDLEKRFPQAEITIDELGPVIGCHLGPGGIGICFY